MEDQESILESTLVNKTRISHIKFSRCKCMGGMFGPPHRHNKYFYCRYDQKQLKELIQVEQLMRLFEPLYSHPILKAQRLLNFIFYSLTSYLAFYIIFAIVWVEVGEVSWEWYSLNLEVEAVIYFLILTTLGITNQLVFYFERRLMEAYLDSINTFKLRPLNLYIELVKNDYYYLCRDSFRLLSTIQIKRLYN